MSSIAWPLEGHNKAEALFLSALESGRLHHGWLIEGPSGIGKARFARRLAAKLLGADTIAGTLDADMTNVTVQKVAADSHPDLKWLARRPDDAGKIKQDIPVDAIREMNAFFSLKAGLGGWRVGVVDSLDELNRSGGNALLKTLEEPPERCLLILISHGTKPLLQTIRSRCRTLRLSPLSEEETKIVIEREAPETLDAALAVQMARGRPGHGLRLSTPAGLGASHAARTFLKSMPRPTDASLADLIARGSVDKDAYEAACDEIMHWLEARSQTSHSAASAWLSASRTLADAIELNMDHTQTLSKLLMGVQSLAKGR